MQNNLRLITNIVQNYGYVPKIYDDIFVPGNHTSFNIDLRFANTDEVRFLHLQRAIESEECDFIWAARGGYGAIRLVPNLLKLEQPEQAKPLVGFSDITVIYAFLNNIWDWPSIHFAMPGVLPETLENSEIKTKFQKILQGEIEEISCYIHPVSSISQNISGKTCGGNMLNILRTFGTSIETNLIDKILLLEDIGEPLRKLDGFLYQILLNNNFDKLRAVIFGNVNAEEEKIISDFSKIHNVPIFYFDQSNQIGHGKINVPIILNTDAGISCDGSNCTLYMGSSDTVTSHDEL